MEQQAKSCLPRESASRPFWLTGELVRIVHAVFCFILLAAQPTFATICSSNSDGNWNAVARWDCGHAPVAADEVVINGHAINLNVDSTVASLTINSGGILQHKSGSDNALTVSSSLTINGAISNTGSGTFTLNAASTTNNGSLAADVMNATGDLVSNGALNATTLNASGNVTSNGGATLTVSNLVFKKTGTQSAAFFGAGASVTNLTVSDGSSVTSLDYSTINLKGSLTNNGSLSLPVSVWPLPSCSLSGNQAAAARGDSVVLIWSATAQGRSSATRLTGCSAIRSMTKRR